MEILTAASLKRSIPKPALEWQVDFLETLVVATFAVAVDELRAGTRRSKPVAFARQSSMYLAHTTLGLSYSQIASFFAVIVQLQRMPVVSSKNGAMNRCLISSSRHWNALSR